MSMLNRFRRQGGFFQLLALIETCDPIKKENLLHLVGVEDPGWAYLVKAKCLSIERIFGWPENVLSEILPALPEKVYVSVYFSLDKTNQEKFRKVATSAMLRNLDNNYFGFEPSDSEVSAAQVKLIQVVRSLEVEGKIKFQTFDPSLIVDPSIAA